MKCKLLFILTVFICSLTFALSPYENLLLSGKQTHVGLLVSAKEDKVADLQTALKMLKEKKATKAFKKVKISNVSAYSKKLQGKTWVMVYFDYDGKTYLEAAKAFESINAVQKMAPLIEAHPRAKKYNNTWLQMEWIAYIHGAKPSKTPDCFAMVTRIKPEKEKEYRILHQTVWPGVIDQMIRGNYHDFSIFFVEIGDELYEFFHVDYVGTDATKDGEANKADPCTLRWWKLTDPCQDPLPGADGIWSLMEPIPN